MAAFLACLAAAGAAAAQNPPLTVEILPEHPLFLFAAPLPPDAPPNPQPALDAWAGLDAALRPYSALVLQVPIDGPEALLRFFDGVLPPLRAAGVPCVLRLLGGLERQRIGLDDLDVLLAAFTHVVGLEIDGLRFDRYAPPGGEAPEIDLQNAWAAAVVERAARYGRFVHLPLGGFAAARMMANGSSAALRAALRAHAPYVVLTSAQRGPDVQAGNMAAMGFWLEGGCAQWGVAPDARWYRDAAFAGPGVYGFPAPAAPPPPALYRAMVLLGAMAGACVYAFPLHDDLWFGPNRAAWDAAIAPTLLDLIDRGHIAAQDFVVERARAAYRLAPAAVPDDFLPTIQDIDAAYSRGTLMHALYGVERPAQTPELIPNRSDRFWMPMLSPEAPAAALQRFAQTLHPVQAAVAAGWDVLLAPHFPAAAGGPPAYVQRVGRTWFVLNTRENETETQAFAIDACPAPVRGIEAVREDGKAVLSWPFRENDVSYAVWRRVGEAPRPALIARGLTERRFEDPAPPADQPLAYAVTALTGETEPYAGAVGYGQYLAISAVESRIAEEAVLAPLLAAATAAPVAEPAAPAAPASWPNYDGLDAAQQPAAAAIVAAVDALDAALAAGDLAGVMAVYDDAYAGADGAGKAVVQEAYRLLFSRYTGWRLHRQVRQWAIGPEPGGEAGATIYLRISAAAPLSPEGREAWRGIVFPAAPAEIRTQWSLREGTARLLHADPPLPTLADVLPPAGP